MSDWHTFDVEAFLAARTVADYRGLAVVEGVSRKDSTQRVGTDNQTQVLAGTKIVERETARSRRRQSPQRGASMRSKVCTAVMSVLRVVKVGGGDAQGTGEPL